jgi:hypothetical protein
MLVWAAMPCPLCGVAEPQADIVQCLWPGWSVVVPISLQRRVHRFVLRQPLRSLYHVLGASRGFVSVQTMHTASMKHLLAFCSVHSLHKCSHISALKAGGKRMCDMLLPSILFSRLRFLTSSLVDPHVFVIFQVECEKREPHRNLARTPSFCT